MLISDNYRMLHGRTEFKDEGRHIIRILGWPAKPFGSPPKHFLREAHNYRRIAGKLAKTKPRWITQYIGLESKNLHYQGPFPSPQLSKKKVLKLIEFYNELHLNMKDSLAGHG
jgi:hypothetical protein